MRFFSAGSGADAARHPIGLKIDPTRPGFALLAAVLCCGPGPDWRCGSSATAEARGRSCWFGKQNLQEFAYGGPPVSSHFGRCTILEPETYRRRFFGRLGSRGGRRYVLRAIGLTRVAQFASRRLFRHRWSQANHGPREYARSLSLFMARVGSRRTDLPYVRGRRSHS